MWLKRFRFTAFLLIALVLAIGAYAGEKKFTYEDIANIKGLSDPRISPDGNYIAYVVTETDVEKSSTNSDIWLVPTRGVERIKLTNSPRNDGSPRWSPSGKKIAFISGRSGKNQVWLISPFGGEAIKLTDAETGVSRFVWAPDGKRIAYLAKDAETKEEKEKKKKKDDAIVVDERFKMSHIWIIDIETKKARRLTDGDFDVGSFSFSPDGEKIAFSASPTPRVPDYYNSDIYSISAEGGKPEKLVSTKGPDSNPRFSPDGKHIAYISQGGNAEWWVNSYVFAIPSEGGEPRNITQRFDEEIYDFLFSPDSRYIYFGGGKGATNQLFRVRVRDGKLLQITGGNGVFSSFTLSGAGKMVTYIYQDPINPPEVYCSQVASFSRGRSLTDTNPQLKEFAYGETELIDWKSVDNLKIEGVLVKPVGYTEGKRYPLLVIVHGGPAGVFSLGFRVRRGVYPIQMFAQKGYLVLMPNPRGSGNYGEEFRKANLRDWGGKDYQDIMAGVDHLIEEGMADSERMGIMGWSYGGFMTSWVITKTRRFKAASVGAGVTNLYSFVGITDIPEFMRSYFKAYPWEDPAVYMGHSAMYSIKNAGTPTLIQQGKEDARVPAPQSRELYIALKRLGVPVTYVVYPRQEHGIREPKFIIDAMRRNFNWFNQHILGEKPEGKKEEKAEEK
jgi:dipeptidyl aminopeptidase/acylaminoacyl peptidase